MKKCLYCNSDIEEDALFCTSCGRQLQQQKKCIQCGKSIDDDCDWCTECGAKQIRANKGKECTNHLRITCRTKIIISLLFIIFVVGFGVWTFLPDKKLSDDMVEHLTADSIRVADPIAAIDASNAEQATSVDDSVICPEPRCGGVAVQNVSVTASNTLENQAGISYEASHLVNSEDGVWATHFTGKETLTFAMNANRLYKIYFINGYRKSANSFRNNSRARDIEVYVNGTLVAKEELFDIEYEIADCTNYVMLDKEYDHVTEVKIVVLSVYEGDKWNDLCIDAIGFYTK